MTWADAMGLVVLEGLIILVLVLTGFREAVFHAVPDAAQGGDQRRHRPVHRAHRLRRRRLRAPHRQRSRARCSSASTGPRRLADRSSSSSACCSSIVLMVRKVKRRHPHRHRRGDRPRDRHRGDRQDRPDGRRSKVNPTGWGLNVPALPDQVVDAPDFATVGQFSLFGSFESDRRRRRRPARLHADARRLLRHDGHDGRRSAPRPTCSTRTASRPAPSRILVVDSRRRRRRWRRGRLVQHLATSSRRRASARVRAPGWPRS